MKNKNKPLNAKQIVKRTLQKRNVKQEKTELQVITESYEKLEKAYASLLKTPRGNARFAIKKSSSGKITKAVAVVLASDWHVEELVDPATVNNKNSYSLDISKKRAALFFERVTRLIQKERQDVKIEYLVLALLGDFITGDIHDELPEICQLRPPQAMMYAENLIIAGIEYIMKNTDLKLIIPCHVGNHGRASKTIHHASEVAYSYEYIMYKHLERYFSMSQWAKRIDWRISLSYHQIIPIFDLKVRFHHGHAFRSLGGIGDIYPAAYRKIFDLNIEEPADLDCFGHHHRTRDGGVFLCNGSMIGYGAFGVKFGKFERPKQTFFLIDERRGRTVTIPILLD